jgi:hypothetical protein
MIKDKENWSTLLANIRSKSHQVARFKRGVTPYGKYKGSLWRSSYIETRRYLSDRA